MRNLGPTIFQDDTVLTEHLTQNGPLKARSNLKGPSFKVNGPITVDANLEIREKLRINGPGTIRGTLICSTDSWVKINGPLTVDQGIQGGTIRVNGPLTTEFADVYKLQVHGPVEVTDDMTAADEILITLGHSKRGKKIHVGGVISAPYVHIKDTGSILDIIPGSRVVRRIFGRTSANRDKFTLSDLRITTDHLVLEGVELVDCEVEAQEIEILESSR